MVGENVPARMVEQTCAVAVEQSMADAGRVLGPRRRRDARDRSGLRVDFTYDDALPPVALEVTTVEDDAFRAAIPVAAKVAERLEALRVAEGLAAVEVIVSCRADLRAVEQAVANAIRAGVEDLEYSSADLAEWVAAGIERELLAARDRLREVGVRDLRRRTEPGPVGVSPVTEPVWGTLTDLEEVCAANRVKLLEVGDGFERHLVVGVTRFGVSNDPGGTVVPALPVGVDWLWVVSFWARPGADLDVWSATPGASVWTVHRPVPRLTQLQLEGG